MIDVRVRPMDVLGKAAGTATPRPGSALPEAEAPYRGTRPCACGGAWRYILAGTEGAPVWRCLHCGMLSTLRSHLDAAGTTDGEGGGTMAPEPDLLLYQQDGGPVLAMDGRAWAGITDALTALRQEGWTLDDVRTRGEDALTYTFSRCRPVAERHG